MTSLAGSIYRDNIAWRGWKIWRGNRDALVRGWKVEVGGIAVEPFIVLVAIGFGLGAYVEQDFNGLSYAEFVAPGILASYAMWHATFDSTFGAYLRMETHNVYEAVLFTPLEPEDIVFGEVLSAASRSILTGVAVLVAAWVFGLVHSPYALLAIPAAFLTGIAFGATSMILTATVTTIGAMNNYFTLVLTPVFFFSGVFYPLDRLPETVQQFSWLIPLTPATALIRGFVTGQLKWAMLLWILGLVVYSLVTLRIASFFMRRRLVQ